MRPSSSSVRGLVALLSSCVLTLGLAACGDDGHDHLHPDAATASDGGVDAAPRQVVSRTVVLTAPALREGELHLVAGDRVHVLASTSEPRLQWNVHTHVGGTTTVVASGMNATAIDTWLEATAVNDYFLVLLPQSGTLSIAVTLELYGQAQYNGGLD